MSTSKRKSQVSKLQIPLSAVTLSLEEKISSASASCGNQSRVQRSMRQKKTVLELNEHDGTDLMLAINIANRFLSTDQAILLIKKFIGDDDDLEETVKVIDF